MQKLPLALSPFRNLAPHPVSFTPSNEDDWIAKCAKVQPLLSGVMSVAGFITSTIKAQEDAKFQRELITSLQNIERELASIRVQLDKIYDVLKDIEKAISGLALNEKLTSLETWGEQLAALDPEDKNGAQNLATAMMNPQQSGTNLLGCMNYVHNAMVGQSIGTPLIKLVDAPGFVRLHAKIVQALHLLAFATAFNRNEKYFYGVFLRQWSAKFDEQIRIYFAGTKDYVPKPDWYEDRTFSAADTISIFQYAQPSLSNVAIAVDGNNQLIPVYSGDLGWSIPQGYTTPMLGFKTDLMVGAVDLAGNRATTDINSPLFKECNPFQDPNHWCFVTLQVVSGFTVPVLMSRVKLVCGARVNPNQTFLGAVNGQMGWVEATGPGATYLCAIHDGSDPKAALLTYDATAGTVSSAPFDSLSNLTPALWNISWVSQGTVSVSPYQSTKPAFLTVDSAGKWQIAASSAPLVVKAAPPVAQPMAIPFNMAPSAATVGPASSPNAKTILFHQM